MALTTPLEGGGIDGSDAGAGGAEELDSLSGLLVITIDDDREVFCVVQQRGEGDREGRDRGQWQ